MPVNHVSVEGPLPPPRSVGLFDAAREHDACGVGFVADLSGKPSRAVVVDALEALARMNHRGAAGAEVSAMCTALYETVYDL